VADFVICPRCRRQNPADAVFCNRCGVRLLNAGVYYNRRDSSATVGMGQLILGLGVLILAGVVLGGGAIVLLGSSPTATPTNVAGGPTPSDQPFSSPTLSAAPSSTLVSLPPTPTLLATATPTPFPTPSATPTPTATPSPTLAPTPSPTPLDCAVASQGSNVRQWQLGMGHDTARLLPKTWCIRNITIDGWSGWGTAKLMNKNAIVFQATCLPPGPCTTASQDFVPPYQADRGKTLTYKFSCFDDPATADVNECADPSTVGAVITIQYEPFAGP
jgi:hypothetical protein